MTKIKFGSVKIAQEDGSIKTIPIEWYVMHDEVVTYRKYYRTDNEFLKMPILNIIPTCNIGILTADEVHEFLYNDGFRHTSKFFADLFMKDLFSREEQEKIMRALYSYSYDKTMPYHMLVNLPFISDIDAYPLNFSLIDGSGNVDTLVGYSTLHHLMDVYSATQETKVSHFIDSTYKGTQNSGIGIRPILRIALPQEEYDAMKVD